MNEIIEKNKGTWYFDLGKRRGMGVDKRNKIRRGGGAADDFRVR
jgi:hypothetical protein